MNTKKIEVLFKLEERGNVLAIFPSLTENNYVTCYAHIGQHGLACLSYIENLEDATPEQSEELRKELITIGYEFKEEVK